MRFDWYQATVEDKALDVLQTIQKLGHEVRPADGYAKMWRYQQGWAIHHNDRGVVAHVLAGGSGKYPHVIASAEHTDALVDVVRSAWPDRHLVSRADAAQDFNEEHAFDRIRPITRRVAKRHRLAFPKIEDDLNEFAGRTQYVGSAQSDYRCRLYEKGWEQVGKLLQGLPRAMRDKVGNDQVTAINNLATGETVRPQDWTRIEFQARPRQEEGRRFVASASPEDLWRVTPWAVELAQEAMALELERMIIRTKKVSADEEQRRWLIRQYSHVLTRWHEDCGDWTCVGKEIGDAIAAFRMRND